MIFRPHDLLRFNPSSVIHAPECPAWVREVLAQTPWAVVRRADSTNPNAVPIGIRGSSRDQRYATSITRAAIQQVLCPENLVSRIQSGHATSHLPALRSLPALAAQLHAHTWGPTGSVGFHLATGTLTISPTSDLDLILRYEQLPSRCEAAQLFRDITAHALRPDILLELPQGALSLQEYVTTNGPLVMRTAHGPIWMDPKSLAIISQEAAA